MNDINDLKYDQADLTKTPSRKAITYDHTTTNNRYEEIKILNGFSLI